MTENHHGQLLQLRTAGGPVHAVADATGKSAADLTGLRSRSGMARGRAGTLVLLAGLSAWLSIRLYDEYQEAVFTREVIRTELSYFAEARHPSGLFVDHVRIDDRQQVTRGLYHAASRAGFQVAVLLKIISGAPGFEHGWSVDGPPEQAQAAARTELAAALATLEAVQQAHPQLRGFLPWGRLEGTRFIPDTEIRLGKTCSKLPAIDQGILAFALAAASWRLDHSSADEDRALAAAARRLLQRMDFSLFYDSLSGVMCGNVFAFDDHVELDRDYLLADHTESLLPVIFGVLHEQIPSVALKELRPRIIRIVADDSAVSTFETWRGSWHEVGIPLLFLPLQRGRRIDLYRGFLKIHESHAHAAGMVGFPATAYGVAPDGQDRYLQMGLSRISRSGNVDSESHAVFYASCLAAMIDRRRAIHWVHRFGDTNTPGPLGAYESSDQHGRHSMIYSTDAKALSVLGLSGGVVDDVMGYLALTRTLSSNQTLEQWLVQLLVEHGFTLVPDTR